MVVVLREGGKEGERREETEKGVVRGKGSKDIPVTRSYSPPLRKRGCWRGGGGLTPKQAESRSQPKHGSPISPLVSF